MFRPEVKKTKESMDRINSLRDMQGSLSQGELMVAIVFSFSLILWITEGIHGLNSGLISLALCILLFLPKIGVIKIGGVAGEVPWGSITLFAASMFLARGVGRWRAMDIVAERIFEVLELSGLSFISLFSLIVFVSMFLHVAFTSTTVFGTVMVPFSISLAGFLGLKPQTLALPMAYLIPIALILPVNTIPNVVFFSSGYFNQKQLILYGSIISIISALTIILFGLPYWTRIGLL
jgi:di/tricarboxylate transporter